MCGLCEHRVSFECLRETYIANVFVFDKVYDFTEFLLVDRDSVLNQAHRIAAQVKLVDDLVKGLFDFRSKHFVSGTTLFLTTHHAAAWEFLGLICGFLSRCEDSFGCDGAISRLCARLASTFVFLVFFLWVISGKSLDLRLVSYVDVRVNAGRLNAIQFLRDVLIEVRLPNNNVLVLATSQKEVTQG